MRALTANFNLNPPRIG